MDIESELKDAISRVNSTLRFYEKDYVSCKRTFDTEKEYCSSFEQFIEIRFNLECSKIPELSQIIEATHGHLFVCTLLEEPNTESRKYKLAHLKLITPDLVVEEDLTDEIREELERVKELLGGSNIAFNSVKKKIKLFID